MFVLIKSNLVKSLRLIIITLVCSLNLNIVFGLSLKKGLYFNSHDNNIEKRTSLLLNGGEPYILHSKDLLSLEFDLYLRNENIKFGYIFRIITNTGDNFDLLVNNFKELFFVINKKDFHKKENLLNDNKLKVKVSFDKQHNKLLLDLGGEILECPYDLSGTSSLFINFGECKIKNFRSSDVPPIILDNVIVRNKEKTVHNWVFNKYFGNIIYDEIESNGAIFNNGKMLIDNSTHWKKLDSFETKIFPQIAFDSISNNIFILNDAGSIAYSVEDGLKDIISMENNIPLDLTVNHFIYDYFSRRLLSYNFNPSRLNYYDSQARSWDEIIDERSDYSQHNRYISLKDSSLYLFGGYGHYKYKGTLYKVNLITGKWEEYDLSKEITPRFLASMGGNSTGDKLYILGGRGAAQGRQELSPENLFDLFEVDLKSKKVKLVCELPEDIIDKDFVFSNSLVVDDKNESLYVLAYPNAKFSSYAILKKLSLTKSTFETYGDTLDFNFHDVTSFCDLFYSPSLSKLIAIAAYATDDINSSVNIYSLDFPPLKESDVSMVEPQTESSNQTFIAIIVFTLSIIGGALYVWYARRKKSAKAETEDELTDETTEDTPFEISGENDVKYYDRNKSSILFLGGFQIYNKSGEDITGDFTPTLKYLLVLILLYTIKDNKGISSIKLQEFLWFDKSEDSARNNRNVNLRKLRMLLEDVGTIEISNKNSYWSISLSDDVFCDYTEILNLVKDIKNNYADDPGKLNRLLELLSYGNMLPNIQYEWIDNFKSDFYNLIIDILIQFLESENQPLKNNFGILIKISDVILTFDPINEEAIAVKCQTLYDMGKKGLAKTVYSNFVRDYQTLLGENYEIPLKTLLSKKISSNK